MCETSPTLMYAIDAKFASLQNISMPLAAAVRTCRRDVEFHLPFDLRSNLTKTA
jgi:hypothetical protein